MKRKASLFAILILFGCTKDPVKPNDTSSGTISTFAGPGSGTNYAGDGGPAASATIGWITSVAVDADANLYFTDGAFNTVRKVNASNSVINTIAGVVYPGTDLSRYSGDGEIATSARLNIPLAVAVNLDGDVIVADAGNNAVRIISGHDQSINSLVGKSPSGESGYSGDGSISTSARLWNPYSVACDVNGDVYIADSENHAIRKITKATGVVETIAGLGPDQSGYSGDGGLAKEAKINSPKGIAVDINGNVYFSDANNVIRKISGENISTVAGTGVVGYLGDDGMATAARLSFPSGLAVDVSGNLYISDSGNHVIRMVTASTGKIKTVAGSGVPGYSGDNGPALSAKLNSPVGVAIDKNGNLFIADSQNGVVRVMKLN